MAYVTAGAAALQGMLPVACPWPSCPAPSFNWSVASGMSLAQLPSQLPCAIEAWHSRDTLNHRSQGAASGMSLAQPLGSATAGILKRQCTEPSFTGSAASGMSLAQLHSQLPIGGVLKRHCTEPAHRECCQGHVSGPAAPTAPSTATSKGGCQCRHSAAAAQEAAHCAAIHRECCQWHVPGPAASTAPSTTAPNSRGSAATGLGPY